MAYSVKNTRNTEVTTVADNTLKVTTFGIRIPGKNFSGYGEAVAQTLLHILENHAAPNSGSDTPNPSNPAVDLTSPVEGQLWYDTTNRKLRVWDPNDSQWKISSGAASVGTSPPSAPAEGDLWWNTTTGVDQLFSYDGTNWILVGPVNPSADDNRLINLQINSGGTGGLASGAGAAPTGGTNTDAVGILVNGALVGIWSNTAVSPVTYFFTPLNDGSGNVFYYTRDVFGTSGVLKGLNIGENTGDLYWFNGKAKSAETADQLNALTATNFMRNDNASGASASRLPAVGGLDIGGSANRWSTIWANTFDGEATSAQYADLAERYEADQPMEEGDIVKIGGDKEITKTAFSFDENVFGVISTNPGFKLNEGAGSGNTHPYVALSGRVPCKVKGKVQKGQRLVSSDEPGVAMAVDNAVANAFVVIGRALESKDTEDTGMVEVVVGAK